VKRIDFSEAINDLPITREGLAHKISNTPPDIVLEYITGMEEIKKRLDLTIAIFQATDGKFFHELLEEIDEQTLVGIDRIVDQLNDAKLLERIDELIYASVNFSEMVNNKSKAKELLTLIKELGDDQVRNVLSKIIPYAWDLNRLNRVLLFYLKKDDEEAVLDHLRRIDEKDLASMTSLCKDVVRFCNGDFEGNSQAS